MGPSGDRWKAWVPHTTEAPRQDQHGRGEDARVFVGKYERQLDPKGRLALPSDFRPRFEPRCYLAYGQDGCIEVMTPEAFEDMANDLIERQKRGELTLAELRTKASNAFAVAVDGQGRVTIDRDLRSFAGIEPGSPVVVSGAFDRVEVWHPESFERINTAGCLALKGPKEPATA